MINNKGNLKLNVGRDELEICKIDSENDILIEITKWDSSAIILINKQQAKEIITFLKEQIKQK